MMPPLVERHRQVLDYIIRYMDERKYAPSVSEIARGVDCTWHSAKYALYALQREGYIDYMGSRQIVVLWKQ